MAAIGVTMTVCSVLSFVEADNALKSGGLGAGEGELMLASMVGLPIGIVGLVLLVAAPAAIAKRRRRNDDGGAVEKSTGTPC